MNSLAQIISFIANPVFVFFPFPYFLMSKLGYDAVYALKWTLFTLIFHLIVVIFVLYQVRRNVFTDMDVSKREQRFFLFGAVGISITLYLISLIIFRGPLVLFVIVWGSMVGLIMAFALNLKIKASLHIAVLTSVLIILTKTYNLPYIVFLLIPVVGWSRITIKRHTFAEVIAGCILGICITLVTFVVLKYLHIY